MKPRISIAMATYNGARYIREQLDSLGGQTLLPYELVICDDGSQDETLMIAEAFASSAPFPVHIHRNIQQLGYGDNFLHAASLCLGDWIAFCDQDDVWLPEKLARCAEFMHDKDLLLCVHSAELVDEMLRPLNRRWPDFPAYIQRLPNTGNPWSEILPGFAMVLRSSLLNLVPTCHRIESHLGAVPAPHDLWVDFLAASLGKTVFIPDTLARYRQHQMHASGAPHDLDFRARVQKSLRTGTRVYGNLAQRAAERKNILSSLAITLPQPLAENATRGSARYARLQTALTLRMRVYASTSPFARTRLMLQALLRGAYGRVATGHLGPKALLKDTYLLLFSSMLSKSPQQPVETERHDP